MKKTSIILLFFLQSFFGFSQATNLNFELSTPGAYSTANGVSGWTLSSQTATCGTATPWTTGSSEFSIVSTPIISFPTIGNIGNSPLGGFNVARLNNSTANSSRTRLSQTFSVNLSNTLLQCAFAGVWEGASNHLCCEQSGFQIQLKDQSGFVLNCTNYSIAPGTVCSSAFSTFTTSSTSVWTNWQLKYYDLTPYINTLITLEIISTDCAYNDHFGTLFFDAQVGGQIICSCGDPGNSYPPPNPVSFCAGSNLAQLYAPVGYVSYQWIAPGSGSVAAPQGTMSTLTVTNPISNSVYTVMMYSGSGCTYIYTLTIISSTVSIAAIGSSSSCTGGASGSATVAASGSGSGYTYAWYNSTNSLVSTNAVANNLPPGTYSISVSASGSQSAGCGVSNSTIVVGSLSSNLIQSIKPYCNGEAYLSYPGGTNYQWYNNLSVISASNGGTASSYTVNNPSNGGIYHLTYTSSQGCQDSIKLVLVSTNPGTLQITSNPIICQGATNGSVSLAMSPAPGATPGNNWFTLVSTGTTSAYTASVNPSTLNTFSANNLVAGGTYSVNAFDGSCKYGLAFFVQPFLSDYTLSMSPSATVCSGNSIIGSINVSNPSAHIYSWSPTTFLAGNYGMFQNITITPTAAVGATNTIVYTVVVTPTFIACPLTKTISVTAINFITPTISGIPILCESSPNYSIQVVPTGGSFLNGLNPSINLNTGILTPSLANSGINTFTYAFSSGACISQAISTFTISTVTLSVSNSSTIYCGQTLTLSATGADTYTWNNIGGSSSLIVSPIITTTYVVFGTNTLSSCSNSTSLQISVTPSLHINVIGNYSVCAGTTTSLIASGANTYTWNNGFTGNVLVITPTITTTYTVTGKAVNGCINKAIKSQSVAPNPTLIISGNYTICPGRQTFLAAYGAENYVWSNDSVGQFLVLSPNETTTYWVVGTDYNGCSSTKSVTIVVEGCVGLNEFNSSLSEIHVYPNPSNSLFFIETQTKIQMGVYDNLGKLILEKDLEIGKHPIDLKQFSSGMYLLKISDSNSQKTIKLIKSDL